MTPLGLVEALAVELEGAVGAFEFIAEDQPPRRVRVYRQGIPQEEFKTDSFYPMVLVELAGVEDGVEGSLASVIVTCGTYHGERRGDFFREHLNLCECVREYILSHRIIGRRFVLEMPVQFGVVEPQSESFMFSNFFVVYRVPQLVPSVPR